MTEPLDPLRLIELLGRYGRSPEMATAEDIGHQLATLLAPLNRDPDAVQRLLAALEHHPEQCNILLSVQAPWHDRWQLEKLADLAPMDTAAETLLEAIDFSLDDLEARHSIAPDGPECRIELAISEHATEIGLWNLRYTIQAGPGAAPLLWDSRHGSSRTPAALVLSLAAQGSRVYLHHQDPLARVQAIPHFHLHPERYLHTRSYVRPLVQQREARHWQRCTLTDQLEESRAIVQSQRRDASVFCLRPYFDEAANDQEIQRVERLLLDVYSDLCASGRHIHILTPLQLPRVRQLAVDGHTLGQLYTRYKASFIHFGRQPELELAPGLLIDGVYVLRSEDPRMLVLFFTGLSEHADLALEWWRAPEVVLPIAFDGPLLDATVGEALNLTIRSHERVHRPRADTPREDDPNSKRLRITVDAIRLACKALYFLANP